MLLVEVEAIPLVEEVAILLEVEAAQHNPQIHRIQQSTHSMEDMQDQHKDPLAEQVVVEAETPLEVEEVETPQVEVVVEQNSYRNKHRCSQ